MEYKHTASRYTGLWQLPMSLYTVVVNSFVFALIPVAILLATGGESLAGVMLDMNCCSYSSLPYSHRA